MSREALTPGPSPAHGRGGSGLLAAALYTGLSLLAGLTFFLATLFGDYDWVARLGGTIWIFALSMIILMPTITPWVRERINR